MTTVAKAIRHAHRRGYRIDPDGHIVSPTGRVRRTPFTALGRTTYKRFNIKFCGRSVSVPVHRFAGYCVFGERALRKGIMVRHWNNDSHDNRPSNLRLGNNRSNMLDLGRDHLSRIAKRGNRIKKQRARHASHRQSSLH